MYLLGYRSLAFSTKRRQQNAARHRVAAIKPEWCVVRGEFTPAAA